MTVDRTYRTNIVKLVGPSARMASTHLMKKAKKAKIIKSGPGTKQWKILDFTIFLICVHVTRLSLEDLWPDREFHSHLAEIVVYHLLLIMYNSLPFVFDNVWYALIFSIILCY